MVENPSGDCPSVTSYIGKEIFSKLRHLARCFPANMQWPMTLSPTNEAISREIMQKNLFQEKNALIL
jgi:hypothetical protein